MATVILVRTIVDRFRDVGVATASAIGDVAGNILDQLPKTSGAFCHKYDSCAYVNMYVCGNK